MAEERGRPAAVTATFDGPRTGARPGCAAGARVIAGSPDGLIELPRHAAAVPRAIDRLSGATAFTADAAGTALAAACGDRVVVLRRGTDGTWTPTEDAPAAGVQTLAMSHDGSALAWITRDQLIVKDLQRGRQILGCASHGDRPAMAFHPSGDWMAAAGSTLGIVSLRTTPAWRDVFLGGKDGAASAPPAKRAAPLLHSPEWVEQQRVQMRATIDALIASAASTDTAAASADQIEAARASADLAIDREVARRQRRPNTAAQSEAKAAETVRSVSFSNDGRWLWCGTSAGLRAFDTDDLLRERAAHVPVPVMTFTPPPVEATVDPKPCGVRAVAAHPSGLAAVFADDAGRVWRTDGSPAGTRPLRAAVPANVAALAVTTDGRWLGIGPATGAWTVLDWWAV